MRIQELVDGYLTLNYSVEYDTKNCKTLEQ